MKITDLKMNGIKNPMGFRYDNLVCSWAVGQAKAKHQISVKIEVARDLNFQAVFYSKEGSELDSSATALDFTLSPYTTYYWRVTVLGDTGESAVSETAVFETAKMAEPWTADWIGPKAGDTFHPILHRKLQLENLPSRARLYICGLGLYEAYLNGEKVGNELLTPNIGDYTQLLQYQTYDLTKTLKRDNYLEILLGKGWYMGRFGLGNQSNNYGDRMAAIAELRLEYEDGSIVTIPTDITWSYCGSDIEDSGIYDGEIYNRLLWSGKENPDQQVEIISVNKELLKERESLPIIIKEMRKPVSLIHTPAGETVLDLGQNLAGFVQFEAELPEGTCITLEFGEVLQQGNFYNENYREATRGFRYVSKGEKEIVRSHFTYYGFRYIRVSGWPGEPVPENFTAMVLYSDMTRTGYLETGNSKINRLYENSLWSMKSNFIDMPTDCPQRNERLGWTGDAQVFAPTACYHMDTRAFYRKFLLDLKREQVKMGGAIPNYIPALEAGTSSVWGDVATFLPAQLLLSYGNRKGMVEYYPIMKQWVDYITSEDQKNGTRHLFLTGMHFGDWLAQDGITPNSFKGGTDDGFIASVYYCHSALLVSEMAEKLKSCEGVDLVTLETEAEVYRKLSEQIKQAIFDEYFSKNGRLSIDTQTAYVIALHFHIYPDKERVLAQFRERLRKDCYEIKGGFVGAPLLCATLCENGMEELAYRFLFKEDFPSWLYCVNLGATTIWERWNSLMPDGTISSTGMNSFNHYAYGSIAEFLYAYAAGLRPMEEGYRKAVIAPMPDRRLGYLNCSYTSASGTYVVNWKLLEDGQISVHLEIPFHCQAEVRLPRYAQGVLTLDSGSYDFTYQPTEDYRCSYGMSSLLEDFCSDENAQKLLREELPVAFGLMMSGEKEHLTHSLEKLSHMTFMGFHPELVQATAEKLARIKRY